MRLQEINKWAGRQFDPVVIEALKKLLLAGELDEIYQGQCEPVIARALEVQEIEEDVTPLRKAA